MALIVLFAVMSIIGIVGLATMLWLDRKPASELNTPFRRAMGSPSMDTNEPGTWLFVSFMFMTNMLFPLACAIVVHYDSANWSWV